MRHFIIFLLLLFLANDAFTLNPDIFYINLFSLKKKELNELIDRGDTLTRAKVLAFQKKYNDAADLILSLPGNEEFVSEAHYLLARIYALQDCTLAATRQLNQVFAAPAPGSVLLSEMTADALMVMTKNVRLQFTAAGDKRLFLNNFWKGNDPTPATLKNEFVTESFQRIEYALRHFRYRDHVDDRGKIYLRYGKPDVRKVFDHFDHVTECWIYYSLAPEPAFYDFISTFRDNYFRRIRHTLNIPGDQWYLYDKDLFEMTGKIKSFIDVKRYPSGRIGIAKTGIPPSAYFYYDRRLLDPYYAEIADELLIAEMSSIIELTGAGKKASSQMQNAEVLLILKKVEQKIQKQEEEIPPSVIVMPRKVVDLYTDFARFMDENGDIILEIYYGLPFKSITSFYSQDSLSGITLREHLALKDIHYNIIKKYEDEKYLTLASAGDSASYINQKVIYLKPQNFIVALQVEDKGNKFFAPFQQAINFNNFISNKLFISDIQFSLSISPGSGTFSKNNLCVQPYPYQVINRNMPLYIYFEIYQLQLIRGKSEFKVTYNVSHPHKISFWRKLLGKRAANKAISFSGDYSGTSKREYLYLKLDCHNLDRGENKLEVEVKDLLSGAKFTREKYFTIVD